MRAVIGEPVTTYDDAALRLPARWATVVLVFAWAVVVQLLMYGGALWGGKPLWVLTDRLGRVSEYLYDPLVLLFFFGPSLVAGVVSFRVVRQRYRPAP
jgi:hypothetical protein